MKKTIMAVVAAGALMGPAIAQNYKVVITTVDGEKTEFETSNVNSIRFENAPDYAPLTYFIDGAYTSKGDLGIYAFTIASDAPDQWGLPPQVGDAELSLELVGALSDDYTNAQLPVGYYRAGTGNAAGVFDIQKSGLTLRLDEGEDGTNMYPIIDGTVDVTKDGDNYVVKAELILLQGGTVAFEYNGPITFQPGMMATEEFAEDQEFTFTGAQSRFYDNWYYPFVTDMALQFYSGEFDADGNQTEGYWLNMDTFAPKYVRTPDGTLSLADGVYSAEPREKIENYTNIPYTYTKGHTLDFWGTLYPTGSYLNKKETNGRSFRGYIVEGTMTVTGNGTNVVFDFVTDNGKKVKATYSGKINFVDFSEPDKIPDYSSTLTEDVKLDFTPAWELNAKVIDFIFFSDEKSKQGKAKDMEESKELYFRISKKMMIYARAYFKGKVIAEVTDIGFNTVDDVIKRLAPYFPKDMPEGCAVQFRLQNCDSHKEIVYERTKGKGF